jgi:hypothetical protein
MDQAVSRAVIRRGSPPRCPQISPRASQIGAYCRETVGLPIPSPSPGAAGVLKIHLGQIQKPDACDYGR